MSSRANFNVIFIGALLLSLTFSACQQQNQLQANTLQSGDTQSVKSSSVTFQRPSIEIFSGQQKKFDQAYQKALVLDPPTEIPKGVFLTANMSQLSSVAAFFKNLEHHFDFQTIVVLENLPEVASSKTASSQSSSPSSITSATQVAVSTSLNPLQTPYGLLQINTDFFEKSSHNQPNFIVEKTPVSQNTQNIFAPFIKKSFPNTQYVPLFISEKISAEQAQTLAQLLQKNLPAETLVIAHVNVLAARDAQLQDFQQKFIQNVFENFDEQNLNKLPLTTLAPARTLFHYLALIHAQKDHTPKFSAPSTSSNPSTISTPPFFLEYFSVGPKISTRKVFLTVFGDIMLGRYVRTLMDKSTLDYPFLKMNQAYLKYNDFLVANLEGPIARNPVLTKKGLAFRFSPDVAPLLKKYFFDILSGANNHALDMGADGYTDTRELLQEQGILPFGNPKAITAESVAQVEVGNQKIAFLGLDDIDFKVDSVQAVAKIKELTTQGYKVIPFLHWGIEYQHLPNQHQKDLAHQFIDAGAIMVIGAHPHVVQTYETYQGKPIFYSLGNGIFDQYFSADTQEGLSLGLIIDHDSVQTYFFPIKIEQSQMRLMSAEERQKFMKNFVTYGKYTDQEKEQFISN